MVAIEGLDVESVQAHGAALKAQAQHLEGIVQAISALVSQAEGVWQGQDARDFAGWWHQQHRPALLAAAQSVAGLGTSAINNAAEQARASSAAGGSGAAISHTAAVSAGVGAAAVGAAARLAAGSSSPSTSPGGSSAGATTGTLAPPSGGLQGYRAGAGLHPSTADWAQGAPANGQADQWGKAANNCTSWVAYRRAQLGLSIPVGNGGAMGHDPGLPPTLGAVVSYGAGTTSDPGHVMVVEQVMSPDRFRVSEMNWDAAGGFRDNQVWDRLPNGIWQRESGGLAEALKFTP